MAFEKAVTPILIGLTVLLSAPYAALAAAQDAGVPVLLTADGEGHIEPCRSCPTGAGNGGLARRATLVERFRKDNPCLLLDAGNALFGGDSAASHGKVIVAAYDAMGYDAVNVSCRDFRQGVPETVAALKDAKFSALSANLVDERSGRLLFEPYTVRDVGGRQVAILGVTESPPGLELLPQLQQELAGVRVRPVVEALAEWIPKAEQKAGRIVLLYYGSAVGLKAIEDQFGLNIALIGVGGIRPAQLPTDARPPLLGAEPHGKTLASAPATGVSNQTPVTPDLPENTAVLRLVKQFDDAPASPASIAPARSGGPGD